jgi:hypothetical protein
MEADMLQATQPMQPTQETPQAQPTADSAATLVDRVRDVIAELVGWAAVSDPSSDVWARGAGPHVLLGLQAEEAFARITPLGGTLYGLAFRCVSEAATRPAGEWEPMLLVDELAAVVEHALVAVEALTIQ